MYLGDNKQQLPPPYKTLDMVHAFSPSVLSFDRKIKDQDEKVSNGVKVPYFTYYYLLASRYGEILTQDVVF